MADIKETATDLLESVAVNDYEKSFAEQVDEYFAGDSNRYDDLKICDTPQLLINVGCRQLPMLYTKKHLKKAVQPKDLKKHSHGLNLDIIKRLPHYIENPVIILDSASRNDSILLVLSEIDSENCPIVVTVNPNGKGRYNLDIVDSNFVTSVYGRENFEKFIERNAQLNNVLYYNKEKSQELFRVLGLQFPKGVNNLDSNIIIHKSRNIVNSNNENNISEKENTKMKRQNEESPTYTGALPDKLTIEDMENYGYTYDQRNKMLPLSAERAKELYGDGYEIYRIYPDNTEGLVEDVSEILAHDNVGGLFGIEEKEALNALCRELADDIEQYAYERGEYDYTGDDRLSWIADYRANTEYNIYYLLSHKDEKIIGYLFDEIATLDESDELYERATILLSKAQALISDNTLKQDFEQTLEPSEQLYQNIECGNILTREKMIEEAAELYDLGDDTNAVDYSEYYREYNPQSQIEVVIVEPNKAAYIGTVDNNLEAMQKLVGGYIEPVRLNEDTVLICNEKGKLRGLEPNRIVDNTEIVGTFFICKEKNGEYVSLSPNELQTIEATFKNPYGLTQTHISVDKPTYFIDMDGTLARFHDEAGYIERMFEKGFFENLKPFDNAVAAASGLALTDEFDVYILSSVINEQCRLEKNAWLDKYLPEIPHNQRIFLPMGADKSAIIDGINSKCILWDDYNKNLEEWQKAGGTSVKCRNNINHKGLVGELWKGKVVSINITTSSQIEGELSSIAHAESQVEEIVETVTTTASMTMSM